MKVSVKISDLIIITAPGSRIKTIQIDGMIRRNILAGAQDDLSVAVDDPEDRIRLIASHRQSILDRFYICRSDVMTYKITFCNAVGSLVYV